MAVITSTSLFKSTAANQEVESNNFNGSKIATATSISFTSADPSATDFSGNNVNGVLQYTSNGQTFTIYGVISRLFKSGSVYEGFYFIETGNDYALGSSETSNAYILTWPGKDGAFPSSPGTYGTSSDPVDAALNDLLLSPDNGVTVGAMTATTVEEGNSLQYTVTLSASTTRSQEFVLSEAGTASDTDYGQYSFSYGVTYNAATGVVTIPVGVSSFTITAPTVNDTSTEPSETLVLSLGGKSATGTITDNDAITVTGVTTEDASSPAGSGDNTVIEGGSLRYTVTLSGQAVSPLQLPLGTSGSAAPADYSTYTFSNGVTYNAVTGLITVPAGVSSFTITAPTVDDTQVEPAETLALTVGGVTGTGTITDNDAVAPSVGSVIGDTVAEGNILNFSVSLTGTTTAPLVVTLTASGTAANVDYGNYSFSNGVVYDAVSGSLTIPAGVSAFTISVPTQDDTDVELSETLVLTVGGITGTGTITDNDAITVAGITAEDAASAVGSGDDVVEEGGTLRYSVTLSGTTVAPVQLDLGSSGTADPVDYSAYTFSNGVTYDPATGKITIPAGVNSFTVMAPTVDDTAVETAETLDLTIGGVTAKGTITDNDVISVAGVVAEDASSPLGSGDDVVEEGGSLRYTITLSDQTVAPVQLPLGTSGSAAPADYSAYTFSNGVTYDPATGLITVPAGVSSFTITAPTVDDTQVEPAETLALTVGGVTGTGTITDNDAITVAGITAEDAASAVGSGDDVVEEGGTLRYSVTLSGTTVAPVQLDLGSSGTADPVDYSAYTFSNGVTYDPATGKITIPAGVNSFTVMAPTVDDTAVETAETLDLTIGGVTAKGTITDNDVISVAGVVAEDASSPLGSGDDVVEEGGSLRYTITLSDQTVAPVQLPLGTSGSAVPADYSAYTFSNGVTYDPATGLITVPAGVSSFTITAPTVDDTQVEPAETLALTVGGVTGTGTITDNDAITVAGITAEDAASAVGSGDDVVEEGGTLRYSVTLSGTTVAPVQLDLGSSGTADPVDYSAYTFSNGVTYDPATGKITIPAGVNSFTVMAPTVDDTAVETAETLDLTIGGVTAKGTITDNDVISVAGVVAEDASSPLGSGDDVVEEGGSLRYTITLSDQTVAPVQLPLGTSGSAVPADYSAYTFSNGVTYDPATGLITVPAGVSSFTITAPTVDDTQVEPAETLALTVGGVTGTGTITDNDAITVAGIIAEDAASAVGSGDDVVEEGGTLRYSVTLSGTTVAPVQLDLGSSGTADPVDYSAYTFSNGVTYDPATGKITIPAGVNSFTVMAPTVDDTAVETAETLDLTIGGVTAKGTITDNDVISVAGVVAEDASSPLGSGDDVVEEGGSLRYTITLSDQTVAPVQLPLGTSGSAVPADYSAYTFSNGVTYDPATGLITVPAGVSSFTITAPTVDDTQVEPAETLALTVGGVTGTGTITDNDAITVAGIIAEDAASAVGSGDDVVEEGGTLRYSVTLSGTTVAPVQLDLGSSGTADPVDYSAYTFSNGVTYDPATGKITIPAGVNSFTVMAPTVDDTAVETAETLDLTIGGVTAKGTITDNDVISVARVTATGGSPGQADANAVIEGNKLTYAIELTDASSVPLQLAMGIEGAAGPKDYSAFVFSAGVRFDPVSGNLIVPEGVKIFTVTAPTIDDALIEPSEMLTLNIGGIAGRGRIIDNDVLGASSIRAEDANSLPGSGDDNVVEGGTLRFVIALNDTPSAPAALNFAVSGTASTADYSQFTFSNGVTYNSQTGKIVVPTGVNEFTVTVATIDDTQIEASETLTLSMGQITATGTITDNDFPKVPLLAYYQPFTDDWFYAPEGVSLPYACYELVGQVNNVMVAAASSNVGAAVHCYLDEYGQTKFATAADGVLPGQDLGVMFRLPVGVNLTDLNLI